MTLTYCCVYRLPLYYNYTHYTYTTWFVCTHRPSVYTCCDTGFNPNTVPLHSIKITQTLRRWLGAITISIPTYPTLSMRASALLLSLLCFSIKTSWIDLLWPCVVKELCETGVRTHGLLLPTRVMSQFLCWRTSLKKFNFNVWLLEEWNRNCHLHWNWNVYVKKVSRVRRREISECHDKFFSVWWYFNRYSGGSSVTLDVHYALFFHFFIQLRCSLKVPQKSTPTSEIPILEKTTNCLFLRYNWICLIIIKRVALASIRYGA